MNAKDVMSKRVVVARPEMTLRELAQLLTDNRITGAPVVDSSRNIVGVVSQTDLVRYDRQAAPPQEVPSFYRESEDAAAPRGFHIEAPEYTKVADVMTPVAFTADEDAALLDLARLMLDKKIHRIVIAKDGRVRGIVSTMDVLRGLVKWSESLAATL